MGRRRDFREAATKQDGTSELVNTSGFEGDFTVDAVGRSEPLLCQFECSYTSSFYGAMPRGIAIFVQCGFITVMFMWRSLRSDEEIATIAMKWWYLLLLS